MKKVACFAIDTELLEVLEKACTTTVNNIVYSRSKSEIVNEALTQYFALMQYHSKTQFVKTVKKE